MADMIIYRGNPYNATITVKDADGEAYPLTGKTIFFTVKLLSDTADNDDAAVIRSDITEHTTPGGGVSALALTAEQTLVDKGFYKWDLRIYKVGPPLVQLNSVAGTCEVKQIVTKRTS